MVITTDFNVFADKYHRKEEHEQKFRKVIDVINEYTEFINEGHKDNGGHNFMFIGAMEENAMGDFLGGYRKYNQTK